MTQHCESILNVRRATGTLAITGYSHLVSRRLGVPLDAMLDLLLAHGYCRIKHPHYGEYWVTFRSVRS